MSHENMNLELLAGFFNYLKYLNRNYEDKLDSIVSSSFNRVFLPNKSLGQFIFNESVELKLNNDYFKFLGYVNGLFSTEISSSVISLNSQISKVIDLIQKKSCLFSKLENLLGVDSTIIIGTSQLINPNPEKIISKTSPFLVLPFNDVSEIDYDLVYREIEETLNPLSTSNYCSIEKFN